MKEYNSRRIVIGVTSSGSLALLKGFPEYLSDHGWDVHVVCSPGPGERHVTDPRVTVHHIDMSREPSIRRDLVALGKWIRLLQRLRPGVVSAGTPKAGLLGMVSARLLNVPRRTYHLRGLRLEGTRGIMFEGLRTLERAASRCATDILVVSESLRSKVIELGIAKPGKTFVLGRGSSNGVDLSRFRPASVLPEQRRDLRRELGLTEGVPVVGYVGRLTRDKGLYDLAEASARLHASQIAHQVLVVGGVEEKFGDPWESAGLSGGKTPRVIGPVEDTASYYQLMEVLALPTKREGFPNVVLEAAASGIPVVTTTATGARDSVLHGRTGITVPPENPAALSAALVQILANPKSLDVMGRAARQFVENHYDQKNVWRLLDIYYWGSPHHAENVTDSQFLN